MKKQNFTLVELMVVAIIVAILAAVAIPLMRGNVDRAIVTEAEAAMSTINTALRTNFAETGDYSKLPDGTDISQTAGDLDGGLANGGLPGLGTGDLDGTYFSGDCYSVDFTPTVPAGMTTTPVYVIICDGTLSDTTVSEKAQTVIDKEITVEMYSNGVIKRYRGGVEF